MKQRTTEWLGIIDTAKYHEKQFQTTYRSTIAFCDWLEKIGYIKKDSKLKIIDLGSGLGANIYYMGKRYPKCTFVGADINPDLVANGNRFFKTKGIKNCRLEVADIYNLDSKYISKFDGVVSYQTLSWLPEFKRPIEAMIKLNSQWIALNSLFYDGQVSCTIEIKEYNESLEPIKKCFYNVYSLPLVEKLFLKRGCMDFQFIPFEIDIDLPKPKEKVMKTYTENLKNGHRLQISGPLLMPWHFIAARNKIK